MGVVFCFGSVCVLIERDHVENIQTNQSIKIQCPEILLALDQLVWEFPIKLLIRQISVRSSGLVSGVHLIQQI